MKHRHNARRTKRGRSMTFDPVPWAQSFVLCCLGVAALLFARYLAFQTALFNKAIETVADDESEVLQAKQGVED